MPHYKGSAHMITLTTPFTPEFTPYLPPTLQAKRALYFDIETTGLSAQSSYVYLIGCAYEEAGTYYLTQWMCTEPAEEKELLRLFFEKAKGYDLLLHYNGTGFDLPFLEKKAKRHCLSSPLSSMENLDLYAVARKLKSYLTTEDLKLKSMEQFFGFTRTDTFSGGELIEVYAQFLGLYRLNEMTNHSKEREVTALGHVLLLHNAEDIKNLPSLTVLLFLQNLSKELTVERLQPALPNALPEDPKLRESFSKIKLTPIAFSVEFHLPFTLPRDISFALPFDTKELSLALYTNGTVMLLLPTVEAELRYFYPNPADYYYLPLEDCAMHKSVASFVEKEYRKKATAATCYTKKTGTFLPLTLRNQKSTQRKADSTGIEFTTSPVKKEAQKESSLPCFLSDYKSNFCYTPYPDECSADQLTLLAKSIIDAYF